MKLIFVTSCKPNDSEKTKIRQLNSLKSWGWLDCEKEIIIFNRSEEIVEMCEGLDVTFVNDYESSHLSDIPTWRTMRDYASNIAEDSDIIVWVNSDIIFNNTLLDTIQSLNTPNSNFILTGKRKNWDDYYPLLNKEMIKDIPLTDKGDKWEIDYFIFKKNHFKGLPKFYIARMGFDNFLLRQAIRQVPHTIDCTKTIDAIHHTHGYGINSEQTWSDYHRGNPNVMHEVGENRDNCRQMSNMDNCRYMTTYNNNEIQVISK
jgi:hypothetical protein